MVYPSASNVSFRLFSDCSDPAGFCTDFQAREKKSLDCCAPIKGFSCLRRCGSASISVRGEYWMESDQCHFIWIINDDVDDVDDDDYHCGIHLALRLRRPWAYYSLLATTATTYKFRTRFTLVRLVRQNHLPPPSFSLLMLLPHLPSPSSSSTSTIMERRSASGMQTSLPRLPLAARFLFMFWKTSKQTSSLIIDTVSNR